MLPVTARHTRQPTRQMAKIWKYHVLQEMTVVKIPELHYSKDFRTFPRATKAFLGFIYGPLIEQQVLKHLPHHTIMSAVAQVLDDHPDYYDREILRRGYKSNPRRAVRPARRNPATPRAIRPADLKRGAREEAKEHHLGRVLSTKIALDHLREHPRYYQYLAKMERAMKSGRRVCLNPPHNTKRIGDYFVVLDGSTVLAHDGYGKIERIRGCLSSSAAHRVYSDISELMDVRLQLFPVPCRNAPKRPAPSPRNNPRRVKRRRPTRKGR